MPQTLNPVDSSHTGLPIASADLAAATDTAVVFANDLQTVLIVENGGAGALTVTITAQNAGPYDDASVNEGGSVAAGSTELFGPFDPSRFNDSNGDVNVTLGQTTSVKLMAVRMCHPLSGKAR